MMLPEDRQLLDAYRRGEKSAFGRIYRHYRPAVEACLRHSVYRDGGGIQILGLQPGLDLEDAIQATFIKAFAEPARLGYDGIHDFGPYIKQIARNVLRSEYRRRKRRLEQMVAIRECQPAAASGQGSSNPERLALQSTVDLLVSRFLDALDEDDRDRVRLLYEEGRAEREVAQRLHIKRSTLRGWKTRLRTRLLRFMKRQGYIDRVDPRALRDALTQERWT